MKMQSKQKVSKEFSVEIHDLGEVVLLTGYVTLLLRKKFYEERTAKQGSRWMFRKDLKIPREEHLAIATGEYLEWYEHHSAWSFEGKQPYKKLSVKNLEALKAPCRIVNDQSWYDGYIYDLNGKPLYRCFFLDYIAAGHTPDCNIRKAYKAIVENDKVKKAKIIEIPYYNNDEGDFEGIGLEFFYYPGPKEFLNLYRYGKKGGSWERNEAIKKKLKLERFRRKDD